MGDAPLFRGPETALRELAALELAYLFPVAGRFRSGSYDGQIQYRLNGWGRALATRLTAAPAGAAQASAYQQELNAHLAREFEVITLSSRCMGKPFPGYAPAQGGRMSVRSC
jgi:hypothetical protein